MRISCRSSSLSLIVSSSSSSRQIQALCRRRERKRRMKWQMSYYVTLFITTYLPTCVLLYIFSPVTSVITCVPPEAPPSTYEHRYPWCAGTVYICRGSWTITRSMVISSVWQLIDCKRHHRYIDEIDCRLQLMVIINGSLIVCHALGDDPWTRVCI